MHSPQHPDPPPTRGVWSIPSPGRWVGILLTALACGAAGQTGLAFSTENGFFSPFWPLSGVAAGCLLLGGPWMALGVYAGVATHNAFWAMPTLTTWIGPLGIVFESLAATCLLRRALGPRPRLTDLRSCVAFLFLAPWLPVLVNGLYGFGLLYADEVAVLKNFTHEFGIFVLANGLSIALLTPAFAVWTSAPDAAWWRRAAIIGPITLGAAGLIFFTSAPIPPYLLLVPLLAAAVVLGLRGAAPLLALVTLVGATSVLHNQGPFTATTGSLGGYGPLYLLLATITITVLPVAAIVGQFRHRLERTARGADSAGLAVWCWDRADGVRFDRSGNHCLLAADEAVHVRPETLFDLSTDRGTQETQIDGHDALSFWQVASRTPTGEPEEVHGILIDLSERLSLEQARRQAWQSEIELRNLRANLAPHLLFNCLAAVRGIIRTDPERARASIDHLARFLRESTNAQARETIPLLDEWQLCEDFLALQAMRYERDLPRLVEIEGAAYHARVPPIILLNLVENAIKHGNIDQRHPLVVTARLENGFLEATVRNHGTLGPQPTSRPGGLGMARARLHAVYGDAATFNIAQREGDVVSSLRLPAQPPTRPDA
jgi:integral membrane sensor domain MASE1